MTDGADTAQAEHPVVPFSLSGTYDNEFASPVPVPAGATYTSEAIVNHPETNLSYFLPSLARVASGSALAFFSQPPQQRNTA
jgi:hypothetical protein